MTFDDVCAIALAWPGVEVSTSYGTPALKVKGKLLARLKEDGDSLAVFGIGFDERDLLLEAEPEIFYLTDHYRGWPALLIRLSRASPSQTTHLLLGCWKTMVPKKTVDAFNAKPAE
jgi:hypothetical protein